VSFDDDRPRGPWDIAGIHGLQRARQWDVVVTVEATGLESDRALFVALPHGRLVVAQGESAADELAAAVDAELARPYRAEAIRREGDLWVVGANAIETVQLPGLAGEEIALASHEGERTLTIDGEPAFGTIVGLEPHERPEHVVRATRIDGDEWELEIDPL
jgi:hypothetical protein